jgi:NAD-dependent SIR2 family protein deacetylase
MILDETTLQQAAEAVATADALLIGAGAGMGVDSGLPDFRGDKGFWKAYPPYEKLGLNFVSLAQPRWFRNDPTLAWGFYGHRMNLYRSTQPHDGFGILLSWAKRMPAGAFVYTSNVDGHFQRAGFDVNQVMEVHGSLEWLQCMDHCGAGIFSSISTRVEIDEETMRAREPLPACPSCGALARPNVLFFNDGEWDPARSYEQEVRFNAWLHGLGNKRLVIVECGAGMAVPTVRYLCEHVACNARRATLIRINLWESGVPEGGFALAMGALDALGAIDERLMGSSRMGSGSHQ